MPIQIDNIIQLFISKLLDVYGNRIKKVILYGSYARGDYNEHSDVDIMILCDFSNEEIEKYRDEISDIAYDIELNTGIVLSPIIKNATSFNSKIKYIPFYKNVEKEGVILVNG